jgi:hypothetical protein
VLSFTTTYRWTRRAIVHELLHIAFPQAEDEDYDEYEEFIARTTKDTIFLHYIN